MRLGNGLNTAAIFIAITLVGNPAGAWPHHHGQKVRVRFLANSTLLRGTWGMNQDTYLAQLSFPKQSAPVFARLMDVYPNGWPPLARNVLKSNTGTILRVQRDEDCDRPFGEMLLRTAPGDLLAILPERLQYQLNLEDQPTPDSILPCYKVIR